jgi:hypothetical protein
MISNVNPQTQNTKKREGTFAMPSLSTFIAWTGLTPKSLPHQFQSALGIPARTLLARLPLASASPTSDLQACIQI